MAENKRTLKIKNNDSQEEIEEKVEIKRELTEEEVRYEIDTNPDLGPLRTLLNNRDFINATGGKINKETVINRYMTNSGNSTDHEIDINHLLNITDEIIKVVSSELNGYVFNFDGTTDEELSAEQRIEINYGMRQDELTQRIIDKYTMDDIKFTSKLADAFNSGDFDDMAKAAQNATNMNQKDAKDFVKSMVNDGNYAYLESIEDKEFLENLYLLEEARQMGSEEEQRKYLNIIQGLYLNTKYKDELEVDENGNITFEGVGKFREKWEIRRNESDIKRKLLEFQSKYDKGFDTFDKLSLEDKKRLIEVIHRSNKSKNKSIKEFSASLIKQYGLKLFDKDKNVSADLVENIYRSLLGSRVNDVSELLIQSEYNANNTEISKTMIREIKLSSKGMKVEDRFEKENSKRKSEVELTEAEKKSKSIILTNRDYTVFQLLDKIDFSDEANIVRYMSLYNDIYNLNRIKNKTPEVLQTRQEKIMKKYIISNPQYFGRFIKNSDDIDVDYMKNIFRKINREFDNEDIKEALDIRRIDKDLVEHRIDPNDKVMVFNNKELSNIGKDLKYTFIQSNEDKELLKACYMLEQTDSKQEQLKVLKQIQELYKNTKYKDNIKTNRDGKITLEGIREFRRDWERKRNSQDIRRKLVEFEDVSNDKRFDDLTLEDRERLLEVIWRANDPEDMASKRLAEVIAKRLRLKIFDKQEEMSDDHIEKVYKSILSKEDKKRADKLITQSEFDENDIETTLKNLNSMIINKKTEREGIDALKELKLMEEKSAQEKRSRERKSQIIKSKLLTTKELVIFRQIDEIDFSNDENVLKFIAMYNNASEKSKKVLTNEKLLGLDEESVIRNYMISNPQYFGDFIIQSSSIDITGIREKIKDRNPDYTDIKSRVNVKEVEENLKEKGMDPNETVAVLDRQVVSEEIELSVLRKRHVQNLVNNMFNRINLKDKDNAFMLVAVYINLNFMEEKGPTEFLELNKEINQDICKEMIEYMNNNKYKQYFTKYLEEDTTGVFRVKPDLYQEALGYFHDVEESKENSRTMRSQIMGVIGKFKQGEFDNYDKDKKKKLEEELPELPKSKVKGILIETEEEGEHKTVTEAVQKGTPLSSQKPCDIIPREQGACEEDMPISKDAQENKPKSDKSNKLLQKAKEIVANVFNGIKNLIDKREKLPAGNVNNEESDIVESPNDDKVKKRSSIGVEDIAFEEINEDYVKQFIPKTEQAKENNRQISEEKGAIANAGSEYNAEQR